ncbi:MAG: hypothetical protein AB7P14_27485 [Blastocatellales bacterium]
MTGMTPIEFKNERAAYARLTVPELIELLGSRELRARFLAEMALRDATNT